MSTRLAITRASRRRSPRMIARSARSVAETGVSGAALAATAWRTNCTTPRSSRCSRIAPASKRLISRRSSTRPWKRLTSPASRSSAERARSDSSSRRASRTSTDADRVISGERSSWLTSDANRASRSMRTCSADAMSLNELASTPRSGSLDGESRVSRAPPAMALAACAASATGRTARRAANTPSSTPSAVVITPASSSDRATLRRVRSSSSRSKNSKYGAELGKWNADDEHGLTDGVVDHPRGDPVHRDLLHERVRDGVGAEPADPGRPPVVVLDHRALDTERLQLIGGRVERIRLAAQRALHHLGVRVGGLQAGRVALRGEVGAHEPVRRDGEERGEGERAEREREEDAPAQAHRSGPRAAEEAEPARPPRLVPAEVVGASFRLAHMTRRFRPVRRGRGGRHVDALGGVDPRASVRVGKGRIHHRPDITPTGSRGRAR